MKRALRATREEALRVCSNDVRVLMLAWALLQPAAALAQERPGQVELAAPTAAGAVPLAPIPAPAAPATSPAEQLAALVNQQRATRGLLAVPLSRSLNAVAEAHVRDLQAHPRASACNMHSWSAHGLWSACCYTDDHAQASCMWRKPAEITGGVYRGEGFEISAWFSSRITPERALQSWRGSAAHFDVVVNGGMWASSTWRAMGVALSENYAVVWFGTVVDPQR